MSGIFPPPLFATTHNQRSPHIQVESRQPPDQPSTGSSPSFSISPSSSASPSTSLRHSLPILTHRTTALPKRSRTLNSSSSQQKRVQQHSHNEDPVYLTQK